MRKVQTPHRPQNFNRNVGVFFMLFFYENYVNRNQGINPKICGEMKIKHKY